MNGVEHACRLAQASRPRHPGAAGGTQNGLPDPEYRLILVSRKVLSDSGTETDEPFEAFLNVNNPN